MESFVFRTLSYWLGIGRGIDTKEQNFTMNETESVIVWLRKMESGDADAVEHLWERYFERLVGLANKRLGTAPRRDFDEEDVALSVFNSLNQCATKGRLTEVSGSEELWRILVTFTAQKVIDRMRSAQALKRGSGDVRGESVFRKSTGEEGQGIDAFFNSKPSPQILAEMDEDFACLLNALPSDDYRKIAVMRMEGYSNDEIGKSMSLTTRSIERKVQLIRKHWQEIAGATDEQVD